MNKFIMLCGIVASGKSTVAKRLSVEENAIIHSSDKLREELFGDINVNDKNEELFQELKRRIKNDLANGKNVIWDSTNLNYKRRKIFLDEIKKYDCEKICYLIATPYEKCLEQNKARNRFVPEHVIKRMYMNIYIPQLYEGWDQIKIIWNYDEKDFPWDELKFKLDIPQDSPYHTLTVYDHCVKCKENISKHTNNEELIVAALYHDIGKPFTKQFKNSKGEDSEYAHFFQHHLVSAYDSLFYLKKYGYEDDTILDIVNYIQWHMQPFFMRNENEKTKNNFINMVGQGFYDNLMLLHKADIEAK